MATNNNNLVGITRLRLGDNVVGDTVLRETFDGELTTELLASIELINEPKTNIIGDSASRAISQSE